ncbi:MAG: sulfatase-like hydrolase/transferase, partial [Bacteroidota bacterium]
TYDAGWEPLRRARFARQRELGMRDDRYVFPEAAEEVPAWEDFADQKDWIRKMQVYAAMVEEMDKGIGRLVVELAATGQLDNTLILFLSDNGGCAETVGGRKLNKPGSTIGGKGSYVAYGPPGAFLSNVPFRKYKKWVDEGGIATPLIAHWPAGMGLDARGEWRDDVGHVIDLLPTALDAAGLPGKKAFPGRSLLPSFPGQPPADDRVLYWEHFGQQAVRSGPWKLSRNIPEAPWRLFNLAEDPTEVLDVADRQPELIDSLDEAFTEWAHDIGVKGFLDGDDR